MPGRCQPFGDFFEELGAGLFAVQRASVDFLLGDADKETLGDGVVGFFGLDGAEGGLGAVDIAGDVLRAAFGDEFGGGGAFDAELRIDSGDGRGLRLGLRDFLGNGGSARVGGGDFVLGGERGASAVGVADLEAGLGLIEERGRFFLLQIGDDFLGERIRRERGERGIERGDGGIGAAVAELGAGGGELGLGGGDRGADATGFGASKRFGFLFGRGAAGGRRGGLAGLGNLDVDHRGRGGRGRSGGDRSGRRARGGLGAGGAQGVELGAQAQHGGIVGRERHELVEGLLGLVEVAGIAGAEDIGHQADLHVGLALGDNAAGRHREREERGGEQNEERRGKGVFFHCRKVIGSGEARRPERNLRFREG
jgi:hypothetical protein